MRKTFTTIFGSGRQSGKIRDLQKRLRNCQERASRADAMDVWIAMLCDFPEWAPKSLPFIREARSQIGQDLFALVASDFKRNGFFVEIGATNGIELSNTWVLERSLDWSGILVEPAKMWGKELRANREAAIDDRAVWTQSGISLQFLEASVLSTLSEFSERGDHQRSGTSYEVTTVTPKDLLVQHGAPNSIDFLSVDVEGAELHVLRSFPFDEYSVGSVCVEHNFTGDREKIDQLLAGKGFKKVLARYSTIDSWFVSPEIYSLVFAGMSREVIS